MTKNNLFWVWKIEKYNPDDSDSTIDVFVELKSKNNIININKDFVI